VDFKSQGILSSFNGVDIDQRREYVKVSCQSYLARLLQTHGWDRSSPIEEWDVKAIEALSASTKSSLLQSGQLETVPTRLLLLTK
jgi:hypothetical protein